MRSEGGAEAIAMEARNITLGGLFVVCKPCLPLQAVVELGIDRPHGPRLTVRARVVRTVTARPGMPAGIEPGMGLRFERLDAEQRQAIVAIVRLARANDSRPLLAHAIVEAIANRPLTDPMLDYVLGYADGTRSPEALAESVGVELDAVVEMVHQLQQRGLVELVPPASAPQGAASTGGSALERVADRASAPFRVGRSTDLEPAQQREILAMHARTASEDDFEILGLTRDAAGEQIHAAYQALVRKLGPEAYPGRTLGPLLAVLEEIAARFADAHATLSDPRARGEYEAYLGRAARIAAQASGADASLGDEALAELHELQAQYEEGRQLWERAACSWTFVYERRPDDPDCARRAARALLEANRELRRAQSFAERAIFLEPDNPANHRLLARIYLDCGMRLRARKELNLAAALTKAVRALDGCPAQGTGARSHACNAEGCVSLAAGLPVC